MSNLGINLSFLLCFIEATGLLDALKPNKSKETPIKEPNTKPQNTAKSQPSTPQGSQLTRGRTSVRSDAKNDRSKSQPSSRKPSNTNTGKRSSTPGRK